MRPVQPEAIALTTPAAAALTTRMPLRFWVAGGLGIVALLVLQIVPYGNLSFPGVFMDSYEYLKMASFFSPWRVEYDPRASASVLYSQFPPLYPLALAFFGGGGERVFQSYVVHSVIFCAMFLAIARWLASMRLDPLWAVVITFLLCLTTWLHLSSVRLCAEPMFLLLCVLAFLRADQRAFLARFDVALVALIALAALTRSAGWFLIGAVFISIWRTGGSLRSAIVHALSAALPILLWTGAKATVSGARNYAEIGQSGLSEFSGEILALLVANAKTLFLSFNPASGTGVVVTLIATVVFAVALPTFIHRLKSARLDACFIVLYLPVVWLWPYSSDTSRLALPLTVPAIAYACVSLNAFFDSKRIQSLALALFVAVALLPSAIHSVRRMLQPVDTELTAFKKQDFFFRAGTPERASEAAELMFRVVMTLKEVADHVPEGRCIYASHTRLYEFYAPRPFIYLAGDQTSQADCEYAFFAPLRLATPKRNLDAMAGIRRRATPILVSEMTWFDRKAQVAVLAKVK